MSMIGDRFRHLVLLASFLGLGACFGGDDEEAGAPDREAPPPPAQFESLRSAKHLLLVSGPNIRSGGELVSDDATFLSYCPKIEISPEGTYLRAYTSGAEGIASELVHQVSIVDTETQCERADQGGLGVKVAFDARAVLGPKGTAPLSLTVPIAVSVYDLAGDLIFSRTLDTQVAMTSGQSALPFTRVIDFTLAYPASEPARVARSEILSFRAELRQ